MSRMRKDRGDGRTGGLAERQAGAGRSRGLKERQGSGGEDFALALADALRDILIHEQRRAA
jgi:hypothetical protein